MPRPARRALSRFMLAMFGRGTCRLARAVLAR